MGTIWAVFSDSSAAAIYMEKIRPNGTSELYLEPLGIGDPEVLNSAEKAMKAAYRVLARWKRLQQGSFAFSYEFRENRPVITGSSASLAFALALANKLEESGLSVAATGIIKDSSPDSPVERVNYINEKIRGAAGILSPGDLLFYPRGNDYEITDAVRSRVARKKIRLIPVDTVEDALRKMFEHNGIPINSPRKKHPWAKTLMILLLLPLIFLIISQTVEQDQDIKDPLEIEKTVRDVKELNETPSPATDKKPPAETPAPTTVAAHPAPIRLKLDLSGADTYAVRVISDALARKLRNRGFIINEKNYDGTLSGTVTAAAEETPLRPYAGPDEIALRLTLGLEGLNLVMKNHDRFPFPSLSATGQDMKANEPLLFSKAAEGLSNDFDPDRIKTLVKQQRQ